MSQQPSKAPGAVLPLPSPRAIDAALLRSDQMRQDYIREQQAKLDTIQEWRRKRALRRSIRRTIIALVLIVVTVAVARWLGLPAAPPQPAPARVGPAVFA